MNKQFDIIKNLVLQSDTNGLLVRMLCTIFALASFIYAPDNLTAWLLASVLTTMPAVIYFKSFEQVFKTFGISLVVYALLLFVRVWGGSIAWFGLAVFVLFLLYRAYTMRSWVRLWWLSYSSNMRRIWRGEKK